MIRVAIVGAGIGAEHPSGYRALPDRFRVVAMCDTDRNRATRTTGGDPGITLLTTLPKFWRINRLT